MQPEAKQAAQVDLLTNTDLRNVGDFEQLIVRERDGAIVRLRDVATVELASEEPTAEAGFNDSPAIYLSVWPLPRANELEVAERLKAKLDKISTSLPAGVEMKLAYDGTFYMAGGCLRVMVAQGHGAIVNMASIYGVVGFPNHVAYTAAKGAIISLTRALGIEYAARNIRVNAVAPGMVLTPLSAALPRAARSAGTASGGPRSEHDRHHHRATPARPPAARPALRTTHHRPQRTAGRREHAAAVQCPAGAGCR